MGLKTRLKQHLKTNYRQYLLVLVFMLLGLISGYYRAAGLESGVEEHLSAMLDQYLEAGLEGNLMGNTIFFSAFLKQSQTLLTIWLLGLTVIGLPLILVVVFLRSFSLGFTMGFFIQEKAGSGILLSIITLLPQNLVYLAALAAGAVTALNFSVYIVKSRNTMDKPLGVGLVAYTAVMAFLIVLLAAGAFIEAYLTPWLLGLLL